MNLEEEEVIVKCNECEEGVVVIEEARYDIDGGVSPFEREKSCEVCEGEGELVIEGEVYLENPDNYIFVGVR